MREGRAHGHCEKPLIPDVEPRGIEDPEESQGLAKRLYFRKFKPGPAKLKQTLIAWLALDPLASKEEQLTLFLNLAWMGEWEGEPVQGFGEAAHRYFGKPFQRLSEDEYLALVAMVIAPAAFHVRRQPERSRERVARIRKVLSGEYKPKGLMDLYYGPLPAQVQGELPRFSYFRSYYDEEAAGEEEPE